MKGKGQHTGERRKGRETYRGNILGERRQGGGRKKVRWEYTWEREGRREL